MTGKRYCIICGEEITSDNPSVVFCSKHGGPATPSYSQTHADKTKTEDKEAKPVSQPIADITRPWQPGQTLLDTYEVIGKLGQGGMGVVYRVHHKSWNIDLAVKQPKADIFTTEKGRDAFIREAETWVDLDLHPHITSCYYVRSIETIPHVFAECVEGGSLESWIRQEKFDLYADGLQDSLKRILDIAIQFAWGLGYAHEQGLVHQDVKPLNVLMTPEGIVKVTDFGLAKARAGAGGSPGAASSNTLVSGSLHTVAYRSPEQAKGDPLSHKTDIWSWAVSVLEMFNGGVSWMDGQTAALTLKSYLEHEPEPWIPPMPTGLANLLAQCFRDDPDQRPFDMLTISDQLLGIYQQTVGHTYSRPYPESTELKADSLNNKAVSMLDLAHDEKALENWQAAKLNNPASSGDRVQPWILAVAAWPANRSDDTRTNFRSDEPKPAALGFAMAAGNDAGRDGQPGTGCESIGNRMGTKTLAGGIMSLSLFAFDGTGRKREEHSQRGLVILW